jgi:hypothetical protein
MQSRARKAREQAAVAHERAAQLHDEAARFWEQVGSTTHAADERRKAERNRDAGRRDRAR